MRTDQVKTALQDMIKARVDHFKLNQTEAAELCGVQKSRMSEIYNHKTIYGVDSLLSVLERLGTKAELNIVTVRETKGLPKLKRAG